MSAIWGVVDLDNNEIDSNVNYAMLNSLKKYKINRFEFAQEKNVFFGCGIQYVRNNSVNEKLPVTDTDILFTVDGMLDNRIEIANELGVSSSVPDGELFYLAYKKWGMKIHDHVRGAYSFAVYDKINNKLVLSSDYAANRVLYYYKSGNRIYFSTSLDCITTAVPEKLAIDDVWISEYLSTEMLSQMQDIHNAPIKGVKLLSTAQMLVFSLNSQESITFWEPEFTNSDKRSDEEVSTELRNIFDKAANEVTDDVEKTAILLSSGMDSAAIGATVANQLNKQGKSLYSYTSVPSSEYQGKNNSLFHVDESNVVKEICDIHKNIVPTFFSGDGNNALTFLDEALTYVEFPFKAAINMTWVYNLYKQAGEDGSTVLLNGSLGNCTISFGTVLHYATTMAYGKKNPINALRALSYQGIKYKYSRKDSIKAWLKNTFPRPVKRNFREDVLNQIITNKELSKTYNIPQKMIERGHYEGARHDFEYLKQRKEMMDAQNLVLLGAFETKLGLMGGIFVRDITRDKRVCELCFAQPIERFARFEKDTKEFTTRRLINKSFGDILPDSIAKNGMTFGIQSADWVNRLRAKLPEVIASYEAMFFDEKVTKYVNKEYVNELLEVAKTNDAKGNSALMQLACNSSVMRYLINNL